MTSAAQVGERLGQVRDRVAQAARRAGREPEQVRVLAVSKRHGVDAIRAAYAAGQREFGENYVQELVTKHGAVGDLPDLRFRFIGHLQRNKAKEVASRGCAVDTLDSLRLAQALARRVPEGQRLEVLLQVNIDQEPQKAGVAPADVARLAAQVSELPQLELRGLMCIPAASTNPEASRPAFRRLRELALLLGLDELSMGMSADLEVAVEEGATMVRVGTAIFGPRPD